MKLHAELLQGLDLTAANYEPAWKLLIDRFSNKRLTVQNYLTTLIEQPIASHENELRKLIDTTNRVLRAITALNIKDEDLSQILIAHIITTKLPKKNKKRLGIISSE